MAMDLWRSGGPALAVNRQAGFSRQNREQNAPIAVREINDAYSMEVIT